MDRDLLIKILIAAAAFALIDRVPALRWSRLAPSVRVSSWEDCPWTPRSSSWSSFSPVRSWTNTSCAGFSRSP